MTTQRKALSSTLQKTDAESSTGRGNINNRKAADNIAKNATTACLLTEKCTAILWTFVSGSVLKITAFANTYIPTKDVVSNLEHAGR